MRAVGLAAVLAALVAAFGATGGPALAQRPPLSDERTTVLATVEVPAGQTSVTIDIPRDKGRVRALRIVSAEGRIVVLRARVFYGNGQVHFEDRGKPFTLERGQRTREIDPKHDERFVDSIELTIEAPTAPVRVEILALQSVGGAAASRANDTQSVQRAPATRGPVTRSPLPQPPTSSEAPRGAGPAPPPVRQFCKPEICAEVVVLYGTDRKGEKLATGATSRVSFGTERGDEMTLGRAVVSIPSEKRRPKGTWSRPDLDFVIWRIQRAESMERDFTLLSVESLSAEAFAAAARRELGGRSRAFVFVHGYNVGFDDAIFRTAQIAHDTGFDGLAMTYSWPSKGGVFDYNTDSDNAAFAARRLQDYLELVLSRTGVSEVHLVSHSMGTKTLLLALEGIARQRSSQRFGEVILAAPDLLRGAFTDLVRTVRPLARGMTLYASSNDRALQLSGLNRPNEWPVGLIRGGGPPVLAAGVNSIDVSVLNTGGLSFNHSTFAEREPLVADMAALFAGGPRNPDERSSNFRRIPISPGSSEAFWRYAK